MEMMIRISWSVDHLYQSRLSADHNQPSAPLQKAWHWARKTIWHLPELVQPHIVGDEKRKNFFPASNCEEKRLHFLAQRLDLGVGCIYGNKVVNNHWLWLLLDYCGENSKLTFCLYHRFSTSWQRTSYTHHLSAGYIWVNWWLISQVRIWHTRTGNWTYSSAHVIQLKYDKFVE